MAEPLGLYVHIPFCARKCSYCDFNTYAGLQHLIPETVEALCREIHEWGDRTDGAGVDTVFFGGGTPSLLPAAQLRKLMNALRSAFDLQPDCEITSEANPNSADARRFSAMAECGFNRLSLGAQSFHEHELEMLGRWHDADAIDAALTAARGAGFRNVNLDLMHGLPGQSLRSWAESLEAAMELEAEHHSLYALTVEEGTPLARRVAAGDTPRPDPDAAAAQYEHAQTRMAETGYVQYEIANWARRDAHEGVAAACRHNLRYWRNQNYLGFGPGAHSHWRGAPGDREYRWWNVDSVPEYIRAVRTMTGPTGEAEELAPNLARAETMMLGLRLLEEGVGRREFAERHGQDPVEAYAAETERLERQDLVRIDSDRIRLTRTGIMFHNHVSRQFLPD